MIIKTRKQLLEAYANPLNFVSESRRRRLYLYQFLIAIILLGLGLLPFIFGEASSNSTASIHQTGQFGIIVFFLILYGLYRLVTIKRGAANHLRRKLVHNKLPIDLG